MNPAQQLPTENPSHIHLVYMKNSFPSSQLNTMVQYFFWVKAP